MSTVKKVMFFLSPAEKLRLVLLFLLIIISGFFDVLGVASIMPFISILSNPEIIETNKHMKWAYLVASDFGVVGKDQFTFLIGVLIFILLIFSLTVKAMTVFFQTRFVFMREYSIGKRLVKNYINQPYAWHLTRNSSELGKNIISEVSQVINYSIGPLADIAASSTSAIFIFTLLVIVDPILAISTSLSFGFTYFVIFKLNSRVLNRLGDERKIANEQRFLALNEGFGAVKAIKVSNLENVFWERFSKPAYTYSSTMASATILANIPRFVLELVAFGGLLIIILYLMKTEDGFQESLPILSLYAYGGYKLLPSLQQLYASFSQLKFSDMTLDNLKQELESTESCSAASSNGSFEFNDCIKMINVDYRYSNSESKVLQNINLSISAGTKVAFVGPTGSGKTTIIDMLLGLLIPQNGKIKVDEVLLSPDNLLEWQSLISYVPQQIYLLDDTIASNIAFGEQLDQIDYQKLEQVAKSAQIYDFIRQKLPNGFQTVVGERGARLSGGEIQRIGLARALYKDPKLIIMDEATSALDPQTEKKVMDILDGVKKDVTVILIAHRLSTVMTCDIIFYVEDGKVIDSGTYSDLRNRNEKFKRMTAL